MIGKKLTDGADRAVAALEGTNRYIRAATTVLVVSLVVSLLAVACAALVWFGKDAL